MTAALLDQLAPLRYAASTGLLADSFWEFPLFPPAASDYARDVDTVFGVIALISIVMSLLICVLVVYFSVKYRAGSRASRLNPITNTTRHELVWIGATVAILLTLFVWSAGVYFRTQRVPPDTLDIYVVGKQWMWKAQHPSGRREINELHLPLGRPIKATLTSQDVVHSFYVPAFRSKMDALPGRFTTSWFRPTMVGEYHLFCAEYCGADHARMVGRVVVLSPQDYQEWLASGNRDESMALAGSGPFVSLGCGQCHIAGNATRAPDLTGLFGRQVKLADGRVLVADEEYIRESIVDSTAKVVDGYRPLMPSFKGQVDGETLGQLVEYIKTLQSAGGTGPGQGDAPASEGQGRAERPANLGPGRGDATEGQPTEAASKMPRTGDTPRGGNQ